jgi:hypothetical protein
MPSLKIKRGTRAQLTSASAASGLKQGELYHVTDEDRIDLGTEVGASVALAKKSEVDGKVSATGGAASGLTLNDGYTEEVFAVTGTAPDLSPANGSIQTWTLTGNSTPTAGTWASGQSMTLMVDDGSAYTINWASMSITWKTGGGTAPTLLTAGYTVIELAKVGSTIYGWLAGDA